MRNGVTVDQTAVIADTAEIHDSVIIWQFATICGRTKIGRDCVIGSCVWIGTNCVIGESVRIQHGAFIPNGSVIGDRVFLGPNVTATDDKLPRVNNPHYKAEPPIIEDDASIGAGAILLPGIRVGRGALIGAGCVVTKNVEPGTIVKGNPGRARFDY